MTDLSFSTEMWIRWLTNVLSVINLILPLNSYQEGTTAVVDSETRMGVEEGGAWGHATPFP